MEENNNIIIPIFASKTVLDKKGYADFSSVAYIRLFKILAILFFLFAILAIPQQFILKNYNFICSTSFILCILFWIMYARTSISSKYRYRRILISNNGNSEIINSYFFNDRIELNTNGNNIRTYQYTAIQGISETPHRILLHIGMNVYIIVEKETLTGGNRNDFLSFISSKIKKVKIRSTKY